MRFQIKKVAPIGTRTGVAFVNRGDGRGGAEMVTSDVYPPDPRGDVLRKARVSAKPFVRLGSGAARLGLTAEQLSGLEHGRYAFVDEDDWQRAADVLAVASTDAEAET